MGSASPRIVDGERITGDDGLGVTLLSDVEQLGVADVRSAPGGVAPPPHVHERHAEAFLVLAGELTFLLEDGEHAVRPETWVFVPPGVVHTFAVTGSEQAHFLDFHAPSCGAGDFVRGLHAAKTEEELREVRAAFDQAPAPDGGGADPGLVVVARAGGAEGETIGGRTPDRRATLLVDTDALTVTEFAYGPGQPGADLHVHREHADAFLVVEGELVLHYRDGDLAAPAGTLTVLPPGVVHGFDNGPSASRFYNLHLPASGFADYMRGRNPAFDQHGPPADGGVDPASLVAVHLSG